MNHDYRNHPLPNQRSECSSVRLRLDGKKPGGRLQPSRIHETMKLQISFTTRDEVDAEALDWLKKAYDQDCKS
jgi:hypothetical protein